jgi:2-succinyl-6-hydroxy-2,4-cyclohexadiene-1-carboxylate synthase
VLASDTLGTGPRVVLLHGFTQTRRCWHGLDELLARDHEVVRVDLPGHGDAPPLGAPLDETAERLAELVGPAVWVGYSMGGRHVLQVAADHAEVVRGVVTIGATAGIEDAGDRAQRRELDASRAADLIVRGVDRFLEDWLRLPLFATLPEPAAHLEERRANTVEGLASSLVLAGTGAQAPLWTRLAGTTAPARFVVGEHDDRFVPLAHRLTEAWGGPAQVREVVGSGHAAHLERPGAVAAIVGELTATLR